MNELRRGADSVRVEPKAMDVLALLAAQRGTVVSREELFAAVWPGVVVGDEALTQSVIKLRRALGDDPRRPSYIETIAKRGYRLIAPIGSVASEAGSAIAAARPDDASRTQLGRPKRPISLAVAAVVALALFAAGASWLVLRPVPTSLATADADFDTGRSSGWITVAVLPFEALGDARDEAHVARGIGDNLLAELSRLSSLRVIRAADGGATRPLPATRYRVLGTVQRDADLIRVNLHLVDGTTSEQVWTGRFERPYRDLFALQDDIVGKLVDLLPAKLSEAERARLAKRYTRSLDAYDAFLRGQALFLVRRDEDNEGAREFYRRAVALDPRFARAYASLAMTHAMDYRLRSAGPASLARASELAETARLIDPEIPEVHWALGFVHTQGRRHQQAIDALHRAIALDPSFADAYALLAGIHTYVGQPARSIPLLRTAMRLNPEAGYLYFLIAGRAYLFAGDVEQATINLREALLRNPVDVEARLLLAAALAASGDDAGARWEADEVRLLVPGFAVRHWLDTYPMTDAGQSAKLESWLARAGL